MTNVVPMAISIKYSMAVDEKEHFHIYKDISVGNVPSILTQINTNGSFCFRKLTTVIVTYQIVHTKLPNVWLNIK